MQYPYHVLDVFTEQRFSGNPLAVVLNADPIGDAQMQAIAREFGLSETVFIKSPLSVNSVAQLRIFTPLHELAFAGHPTIGTACLMSELGFTPPGDDVRFVFDEGVGQIPLRTVRGQSFGVHAEMTTAQLPEFGAAPDPAAIAAALGVEATDLTSEGETVRAVSCGTPFVLVPLRAPELLAGITRDVAALRQLTVGQWARGLYVYARGYEGEIRARMFAPAMGVDEDPATGSAAVALAGALATESPIVAGRMQWVVHQGLEIGRPSELHISAERAGSAVTAVRLGGKAVRVAEGMLTVD